MIMDVQFVNGRSIAVGDEVWISAGVIILKGVGIGAGSVVTRSVAAYANVAGVPDTRH
jgi:acetyltransferase-like isoleucine patch superfamily enzyme